MSTWTKYQMFKQMYNCVADAMIEAGVAVRLDVLISMDREGNEVDKNMKYGLKVDLKISNLKCVCSLMKWVVTPVRKEMDTLEEGNRFVREVLFHTNKLEKKDNHFTCMGFTNLLGEPVLCVVIVTGKEHSFQIEAGIDYDVMYVGDVEDEDFFEKNVGEGKYFPGGPNCVYKGKVV